MTGLKVGPIFYKIGTGDFLHSFFSTIAYNLENNKWGSRFPLLMNELYYKTLPADKVDGAINELKTIQKELEEYSPSMVVWDIEDLSKQPPWGDNIAERITDLSNYFYTNDGEDLFNVFYKAFDAAKSVNKDINIHSM
ncbi:immunity 70 family protein [Chryseobacterium sp. PTM-20240506]|uniref:immunity 70 family protein n=1 Tax=unclassified Chryseobacterium TaxID=2593645 RepID=UPI0023596ADB|nr:immunity 70 family protein [Chryseobacterium sp. B21-037]MDC8106940.1 immunity 70 family protein [Chryseobacterium sp. B21-037]